MAEGLKRICNEEIDLVVKIRVKELAEIVPLSPDTHQRVEQQLLQMKHRTYLWLHLALDDIRSTFKDRLRPTDNSTTLIPPSVNAAYEKILYRVPTGLMDRVKKILEIIMAARRPLTIEEMAMALGIATSSESRTTKQSGLDPISLAGKLRRWCGLFVFTNNSKIYLIHQTAREFLIQKNFSNLNSAYWSSLTDAEDRMAQICLRYLSMADLEDDENESNSNIRSFLDYSAVHWPDHVRKMALTSDQEVIDRIHQVYNMSGKRFSLWFPIFWRAIMPPYSPVPSMNELHLATFNGHEQEVRLLLAVKEHDINAADDTATYPIIWASLNGHSNILQMLLEHGADINAQGGDYGNALQAACSGGHDKVVEMLLERGADVNAQGGYFGNALQAACFEGDGEIVKSLLEHGADINAQGGDYGNALQAACSGGHDKVVEMLLERGADVNSQGGYFGNALQAPCLAGYIKIVQVLLDWGADVSAQSGDNGNALQAACSGGHDSIVQVLLEHGANVSAQSGDNGNALLAACSEGHDKIVQMLLEWGADVNAQFEFPSSFWVPKCGNALQAACFGGYDKIVQMLLEREADVNAQGHPYGNSLLIACSKGYDKIVQILLEYGADFNTQGGIYKNALQAACSKGHGKIMQMLLERGADQSVPCPSPSK